MHRVQQLQQHLNEEQDSCSLFPPVGDVRFDAQLMDEFLRPDNRDMRAMTYAEVASNPLFRHHHTMGMPIAQQRELVLQQAKSLFALFDVRDVKRDPLRYWAWLEGISVANGQVVTKCTVAWGLFGGTLFNVGTAKHQRYAADILSFRMRGAFCLTELGHGSDAAGMETTATYDKHTGRFTLNTPNDAAQKMWIGNVACHCTHAIVMAQLTCAGADRGLHAFLVPIRSMDADADHPYGMLLPGVHVMDVGPKQALNGVDNGRLWLRHVSIPRDNLLDKYGNVTPDGQYHSDIASNSGRFVKTIQELITGRVGVSCKALSTARLALCITVRYCSNRRQFGNTALLEYRSHQRRLMPLLASTYVLSLYANHVKEKVLRKLTGPSDDTQAKEVHLLAAGMKPLATWNRGEVMQQCRECCGAMGYHAANRIGVLLGEHDIDVTWEGDNTVLLQQVAKGLLKAHRTAHPHSQVDVPPPVLPRRGGDPLQYHLAILRFRSDVLLWQLRRAMDSGKGGSAFQRWNTHQSAALRLARAHVQWRVVQQVTGVVLSSPNHLRPVLKGLLALYSLGIVRDDLGFFTTWACVTAEESRTGLEHDLDVLCEQLSEHALLLVHAFGIPEENLRNVPIAQADYMHEFRHGHTPGY